MTSSRASEAAGAGALLVPAGELGTLAVTGADRKTWLNGLITCDLAQLAPGQACYGLALQKVGRIVANLWVVDEGDRLLVGVRRDRVAVLAEHFDKYLIMEDASISDVSNDFGWAFVHGPRASAVGERMTSAGIVASRLDATGLGGVVLVGPAARVGALFDEVLGWDGVVLATELDWEALRVSRFVPRFGVDFTEKNYPQEAALEKVAVSFNKGCYLGQEVVCRLEMRGHVTKKLVPLRIWTTTPPEVGAEVRSTEGRVLGHLSSVVPERESSAALAMVRYDFADPGTLVDVGGLKAEVLERPAWA
jgi:folate-binding protein YgfZ